METIEKVKSHFRHLKNNLLEVHKRSKRCNQSYEDDSLV